MSKKARSLVFLGPSDGEKVLLCFKWGVLNYALECRLDGVQNHSRSRPYLCTRAFSDGVGWPSPLLHGREDFWVIIHFCCWVGILCVCFQVDIVLQCYETEFEFRSLMAWGKKLLLSLSVFAIMLLKRLPDGSKRKRWLPWWVESLIWVFDDFSSSAFTAFEVDVLQRGESRPWDALS